MTTIETTNSPRFAEFSNYASQKAFSMIFEAASVHVIEEPHPVLHRKSFKTLSARVYTYSTRPVDVSIQIPYEIDSLFISLVYYLNGEDAISVNTLEHPYKLDDKKGWLVWKTLRAAVKLYVEEHDGPVTTYFKSECLASLRSVKELAEKRSSK